MFHRSIRTLLGSTPLIALALLLPLAFADPVAAQPCAHAQTSLDCPGECCVDGRPLDAFLCYDVTTLKGFHKVKDVHVVDNFNDLHYDVADSEELCTPAANACGCVGQCALEAVSDSDTHIKVYGIERGEHQQKELLPDHLSVTTCLGTVLLDLTTGDKLMVPAAKSLVSQPAAPDPQSHQVDHFHCYDLKLSDKGKLPTNLKLTLSDQFTGNPKAFDVIGLEHLCVVADKNDEGVKHVDHAMLCYDIKPSKGQPKHKKVKKVFTTDQFESLRLSTIVEDEACLPATIERVHPVCAGAFCFGGGDCTSQFCDDTNGVPEVCGQLCADPGSSCVCGGDCTSGFCNDRAGSPGFCAPVCADPASTCVCGGDCTSGFCDDSGGSPGHCAPVCAGLTTTCVCGGDCTSGFCDDTAGSPGHCAPVFDGLPCRCGGDCVSGFCDDSAGPGHCVGP